MKINFFGASVTQQLNGFPRVFASSCTNIECEIFGFGARHIKDAGICYIDLALKNRPNILIIDWFSTGFIHKSNLEEISLYVDVLIRKVVLSNAVPVFLFLPQKGNIKEEHDWLKEYLEVRHIPFFDIGEQIENHEVCLKDTIHTTDVGSALYANALIGFLNQFLKKTSKQNVIIPPVNKYYDVRSVDIHRVVHDYFDLIGDAEVIGFSQIVGPYSGYVEFNNYLFNNWDRWCHYEREMINFSFRVSGETRLTVLQKDFDRSSCEHPIEWPKSKYLKLLKLFFIGDEIILGQSI
jgi:hypothetical protein